MTNYFRVRVRVRVRVSYKRTMHLLECNFKWQKQICCCGYRWRHVVEPLKNWWWHSTTMVVVVAMIMPSMTNMPIHPQQQEQQQPQQTCESLQWRYIILHPCPTPNRSHVHCIIKSMQFQSHKLMEEFFMLDLLERRYQYVEEQCTCQSAIDNDSNTFIAVDQNGGIVVDAMEESTLALDYDSDIVDNDHSALTHCLANNQHQNSNG